MKMKKEEFVKIFLTSWFIIATAYMAYDLWNDYKIKGIERAYQAGIEDTINRIIDEGKTSKCQPFEIYNGESNMKLVDSTCLSAQDTQAEETQRVTD